MHMHMVVAVAVAVAVVGGGTTLALLLVVGDAAGLGLEVTHLPQVEADGAGGEGVGVGGVVGVVVVVVEGGAEAADEGVEGAPGLAEGAGAGGGRGGHPEEGAGGAVHLRLPELVQVPHELQHVGPAAHPHRQRRPVVPQVLAECVPVSPLLVLVPAPPDSPSFSYSNYWSTPSPSSRPRHTPFHPTLCVYNNQISTC